ncbi:alpha/beta fold hydrolase [Nocardia panacis]|nr:alpha/beta hydrolase [Nocardia panacis]
MQTRTVRSSTGRDIAVTVEGSGPGVIVVHGSIVSAADYRVLARELGRRCTVYRYDRTGRGDAPEFDLAADRADLAAITEATGVGNVLAHSYGGFVALEAARTLPLDRLAIFDPAMPVSGLFPTDFLEAMDEALRRGDTAGALARMSVGLDLAGPLARMPFAAQRFAARVFLRTPPGRPFADRLPAMVAEGRAALPHRDPARYTSVTANTLLIAGGASPYYFRAVCDALRAAIPAASCLDLPGLRHHAPNAGAAALVAAVGEWVARDPDCARDTAC